MPNNRQASEQEGVPQIFNLRILCEKYLQHQQDLYHLFIDFKKAFDRVWYAALSATMKKYKYSANRIRVIKHLYDKATSAVPFYGSVGDWFRATVGVRQGCLLSPTFFNIFLERLTTDTLEDHGGTVNMGGKAITNLRSADGIDGLAGKEEEPAELSERLDRASTAYGMEINAKKTTLTANNTSGINTGIKVNGQKFETDTSFQYLGSIITDEGSKPEILSRIAQATAVLTRLKPIWIDKSISPSSKTRLMRSLITSIILYAFESWTPTAEPQRRIQAMEIRCSSKIPQLSHTNTMLPTRKSVPKSSRQSDHTKT